MKFSRKTSLYTVLFLLVVVIMSLFSLLSGVLAQQAGTPLWFYSVPVLDVAVSSDGGFVVAATPGNVTFFNDNGDVVWLWPPDGSLEFSAVDISEDGSVVVGVAYNRTDGTYRTYFWKNANTLIGNPEPDWVSVNLYDWIGSEALAISGDGNYVVVVGTGSNVFYWANTLNIPLGSVNVEPTWYSTVPATLTHTDISENGEVIVAGGWYQDSAYLYVYLNSTLRSEAENYNYTYSFSTRIGGLALSRNGKYVAVGGNYFPLIVSVESSKSLAIIPTSRLRYFSIDPFTGLWWSESIDGMIVSVDISDDGNIVAAGVSTEGPVGIYIFHQASYQTGQYSPAYIFTNFKYEDPIRYVSVDGEGYGVVVGTGRSVYYLDCEAGLQWVYHGETYTVSDIVKISRNGNTIVSCGGEIDSIYYFTTKPEYKIGGEVEITLNPLITLFSSIMLGVAVITILVGVKWKH